MKNKFTTALLLSVILFSEKVYSQSGQLDPSFGEGGIVTAAFNVYSNGVINSIAIQKDGKIVTGGYSLVSDHNAFTVARFKSNGTLDNSFGTNGIVTTTLGTINDIGQSLAIQSDGKIILAGYSASGSIDDFALVRFKTNGAVDSTFGTNGIVLTPVGSSSGRINSVKIQKDNKIVAGGYAFNGSEADAAIVRYTSSGIPDTTFGKSGIVLTPVGLSGDIVQAIDIQSNGKIVAVGYSLFNAYYNFTVIRYKSNGDLDSTFGIFGTTNNSIGLSSAAYAVVVQDNGKILTAGYSYDGSTSNFAVVRYNTNGNLDATFGNGGSVVTTLNYIAVAYSLAIGNNGDILAGGSVYNGSDYDFGVCRYHTNGNIDSTFGNNGVVITPVGVADDSLASVAIPVAGKILAAGSSGTVFNKHFTLVRYNIDGSPDTTFAQSGISLPPVGESYNFGLASAIGNTGKIVEAGYSLNINNSDYDFQVCRFNGDGSMDSTFGNNGVSISRMEGSDQFARSVALQTDQKIVIAGNSSSTSFSQFVVARFNTNGTLDNDFGTSGTVLTPFTIGNGDKATSVAVQEDGKILAAGYEYNGNNYDVALVRYKSNGILDYTFGINGILTMPVETGDDMINSIALQKDGKIVAAGYTISQNITKILLIRLNENGSLDVSFGIDGIVETGIDTIDAANSVAIQSDGKIVAGGYSFNGSSTDFAVLRYKQDGILDSTFGTNGIVITSIYPGNDQINSVAIQSDGEIVAGGVSYMTSTTDFIVAHYNQDGSPDNTFGNGGVVITPIGNSISSIYSITLPKDGEILAAGDSWDGATNRTFTLARYLYSPETGIKENVKRPSLFVLEQNYPNPFGESTRIKYQVPQTGFVTLKIFDLTGKELRSIVSHVQDKGFYEAGFNSGSLTSGVYFYTLRTGNISETKMMAISK